MINNKFKKNKNGFTLIELLITVAIIGIIGAAISNFFVKVFAMWNASTNQIHAQQEARAAMDEMTQFIRQSSNSVTGLSPSVGTTSYTQISFIYPHQNSNRNIQYYKANKNLYRIVNGVRSTIIHGTLNSIYFYHGNNYTVHIGSMSVTYKDKTVTYDQWINLRSE